jgi:hypothetical protein
VLRARRRSRAGEGAALERLRSYFESMMALARARPLPAV